jgi:type III restriction enzyme
MALVDGIKYERIGPDIFYTQKLFASEVLTGYLKSMVDVQYGIHEQVIYQSDTERTFAESLDKNEAVRVFAKLPSRFKVPNPVVPGLVSSIFLMISMHFLLSRLS